MPTRAHRKAKHEPELEPEKTSDAPEAGSAYDRLLRHRILEPEEVNALTLSVRKGRTTAKLAQEVPPNGTVPQPPQIARLAVETLKGSDPDLARDCREILPAATAAAALQGESQHPDETHPPAEGWDRWWERIAQEADEAREIMARHNQRLVARMAREQTSYGVDREDLHQMGNVGLATAIERYDERTGNRFTTYAFWWIKQAMQRGIVENSRTVRLPSHVHQMLRQVTAAQAYLTFQLGRQPTEEEIARQSGRTTDEVAAAAMLSQETLSLDAPLLNGPDNDYAKTLLDRFWLRTTPGPEEESVSTFMGDDVRRAVDQLRPQLRRIICARYGIDDGETLTLRELGRAMKLSPERIRQLENRALRELKTIILRDGLDIYLEETGARRT